MYFDEQAIEANQVKDREQINQENSLKAAQQQYQADKAKGDDGTERRMPPQTANGAMQGYAPAEPSAAAVRLKEMMYRFAEAKMTVAQLDRGIRFLQRHPEFADFIALKNEGIL
jgi:hypothetical protein